MDGTRSKSKGRKKERVKEEKAAARKRKRDDMEKEEKESQRTAWSRLEEICGEEGGREKGKEKISWSVELIGN